MSIENKENLQKEITINNYSLYEIQSARDTKIIEVLIIKLAEMNKNL